MTTTTKPIMCMKSCWRLEHVQAVIAGRLYLPPHTKVIAADEPDMILTCETTTYTMRPLQQKEKFIRT